MSKSKARASTFSPKLITLAVASCFAASTAMANPKGGVVVSGSATINQSGNLLQINTTPNTIINWQSFSISAGEITKITQQSHLDRMMNRVVTANPSLILGTLQSNGRVFLINPSGIIFGAGAQVDVAGLVASSLAMSNEDFLGGRMRFTGGVGAGPVLNQGNINAASGGEVYLVGASVTNSGVITTPKGEVVLAAGNSVELVNPGTPALRVEISAPENEARNLGRIVADAGRVGIYAGLINHSGTIRADSARVTDDGRIVLKATKNVTLEAGSVTSASGPKGGTIEIQSGDTTIVAGTVEATGSVGKGGTVHVLGDKVALVGKAKIDVSGDTGGGTVLVGGDFQGKNTNIQNASRTYFGPDAVIKADAITNGNGGKVIIWSDEVTRAYGTISARGGSKGGDGGFVEVSSKGYLDFKAKVDLRAPKGKAGTLLLDPHDVEIGNAGDVGGGFDGGEGSPSVWFNDVEDGPSLVSWSSIDTNLANGDVIITTSGGPGPGDSEQGNIRVVDSHTYSSGHKLQLVAHNNVDVEADVINLGNGEIRFYAGWINDNGSIANAVNPVVGATGDINIKNGSIVQTGGNIFMKAGRDITVFENGEILAGNDGGGNWRITLDAGNKLLLKSNVVIEAKAGSGGSTRIDLLAGAGGIQTDGAEGSIEIFANSNELVASPGGPALINMITTGGGNITLDNVEVEARGGSAGGNDSGGMATVNISSSGNLTLKNDSDLEANGGHGAGSGSGGQANVFLNATGNIEILSGSDVGAFGGNADTGNGGSAVLQVLAPGGSITINDAAVVAEGGQSFDGGNGGSADAILSAGSSINVHFAGVVAAGGEGTTGGTASILMTAGGAIVVGGEGFVGAGGGGFECCTAPVTGGDANVTMVAASILINELSVVRADGGEGQSAGGTGRVALLSTGTLNITGAHAVGSFGGRAFNGVGGDALTLLVAADSITVSDTFGNISTDYGTQGLGVFAVAGPGQGAGGVGGNAGEFDANGFPISGVVYLAGNSIVHKNSHTEAISGTGLAGSGNAATVMETRNGNISILSEGAPPEAPNTVLACANGDCIPNQGGFAEIFMEAGGPTGKIIIENDIVEAVGGTALINLHFPNQPGPEGGWSVNGVDGAITGSPAGFFVNGKPAVPDVNFFVTYGPSQTPPNIDAPILKGIDDILAIFDMGEGATDDKPGKDDKKKDSECS